MSERQHQPAGIDDEPRGPGAWIAALIVIGIGILFLLQNTGVAIPGNWWALFLLIPAAAAFAQAWRAHDRQDDRSGVVGSLITGVVLVVLTAMFMFDVDVDWGVIWPIVLILIGIVALGRAYRQR